MFWLSIEWGAAFLGLLGAYLLANKNINPVKAWIVWILSDILFMFLFAIHTKQYGLLTMHTVGGLIAMMGLLQWSNLKETLNKTLKEYLFILSSASLVCAGFALLSIGFIDNKSSGVEWLGSFLSISGGLLMASKHKLAPISWIIWTVANLIILGLTLYTNQWGVLSLQIGFTLLNIYGCYTWLYKNKFFLKLKKARLKNERLLGHVF